MTAEDPAYRKLVNMMGAARARVILEETLARLGLEALRTADDRYRFGEALIAQGGVLEAVGWSIKVQAVLHGAKKI